MRWIALLAGVLLMTLVSVASADFFSGSYVHGTPGDDQILGTSSGSDRLYGGPGDDLIASLGGGPDYVWGGPGDDFLLGSNLGDRIEGGPGDDVIEAWNGDDLIDGGPGSDICYVTTSAEVRGCESIYYGVN
jgi:Ca2+-binding RTX toxin-like protein